MTALELAALAGISRVLGHGEVSVRHPEVSKDPEASKGFDSASMPEEGEEVLAEIATMPEDEVVLESPSMPHGGQIPHHDIVTPQREEKSEPLEFLRGDGDAQARYYRACDEQIELLVAFLSDGRLRLIDTDGRRFAGMLETEKAELIEIGSNEWSRVFVSATPDGRTQLELQGGPYDTHVLICEALPG